jgi:hypothetical protein
MSTLDYDEGGHVTVTGQATPGTVVRAYINDKMVAEGQAGADGRWRLAPADAVGPGKHKLRLDGLTKGGKPVARLELPFERVPVAPAAGDSRRLVVVRGDNLWNIARAHYGTGFQQILIYWRQQGPDPRSGPDLSGASLKPAQGQLTAGDRELPLLANFFVPTLDDGTNFDPVRARGRASRPRTADIS